MNIIILVDNCATEYCLIDEKFAEIVCQTLKIMTSTSEKIKANTRI